MSARIAEMDSMKVAIECISFVFFLRPLDDDALEVPSKGGFSDACAN